MSLGLQSVPLPLHHQTSKRPARPSLNKEVRARQSTLMLAWLPPMGPGSSQRHIPPERGVPSGGIDEEEDLAILHRLGILHQDPGDGPLNLRLELIHELHGFDDA
jgi:hypothetical protein